MRLWEEVASAQKRIRNAILRTPLIYSDTFSALTGKEVFLKLENLQKGGSFKIRGAYNKLSQIDPAVRRRGVVAASAGNHAQGVAIASALLGVPSTIVMPEGASLAKQMATRSYGGEVVLFGRNTDEALEYAQTLAKDGKTLIHPFDDEQVVAGQGTIGLEILEELPDLDGIVVPVGGGGLISGVASVVKKKRPGVKIIGVQSVNAPAGFLSLKQKKRVEVTVKPTLADGIAIRRIGAINFPILQRSVDEIVTVDEEEIASAILLLMERKRVVAEGAGAAPLAALLANKKKTRPKKVVLVISGGNIDVNLLDRIIEKGLSQTGRMVRLAVLLRDIPGSLLRLTRLMAEHHANILHIVHERADRDIPIGFTRVTLVLETRSPDHIREIQEGLRNSGCVLQFRRSRNDPGL
jgi:threonine dehydratase